MFKIKKKKSPTRAAPQLDRMRLAKSHRCHNQKLAWRLPSRDHWEKERVCIQYNNMCLTGLHISRVSGHCGISKQKRRERNEWEREGRKGEIRMKIKSRRKRWGPELGWRTCTIRVSVRGIIGLIFCITNSQITIDKATHKITIQSSMAFKITNKRKGERAWLARLCAWQGEVGQVSFPARDRDWPWGILRECASASSIILSGSCSFLVRY